MCTTLPESEEAALERLILSSPGTVRLDSGAVCSVGGGESSMGAALVDILAVGVAVGFMFGIAAGPDAVFRLASHSSRKDELAGLMAGLAAKPGLLGGKLAADGAPTGREAQEEAGRAPPASPLV